MLFTVLFALPITLCSGFPLHQRAVDFYPPGNGGGSMLDNSSGLGEPLNVIVSGMSSTGVLTDAGFLNYVQSLGYSTECFGIHLGTPQTANLGDGNGDQPEVAVIRQDFGNPGTGTCLESIVGGNHFRYWRQNGSTANSGALFLAVSHEENLSQNHDIEADGYDKGRDELVAAAVTSQTTFGNTTYSTTYQNITGLLPIGSAGINHNISIDGMVALLSVTMM